MMGVSLFIGYRKDGVPLGSKQALSNGNEPEELTDLIAAFEAHNKCKITLTCSLQLHKGYLDTRWSMTAHDASKTLVEVLSLGLASVEVWAGDYKTLKGLLTRLLYALDFQLALNEFASVETKKA